jgi:hypothetical protein
MPIFFYQWVVRSISMKHFEEVELYTADHKPANWLRYIKATFAAWSYGPARMKEFLHHLSSLTSAIKLSVEDEAMILFRSWESWPIKCIGNLVIHVVIITSMFNHSHHLKTVVVIASQHSQYHMTVSQGFRQGNEEQKTRPDS